MQKDSRLVTITLLKHNCANHIRYIRLLDTIKDIKFRTRHYICCRDTAFNENKTQYNICEQVLEKVAFVATLKEDDGELFYPLGDSC